MKKLQFLSLIFVLFLFACSNTSDPRIEKAETLLEKLDSVKAEISKIDADEVAEKYNLYMENIEHIQKVFNDTAHSDEEWEMLTSYATIKKPLRDYPAKHQNFEKELDYSITQIKALIQEYEEEKIDSTKFDEYYQTELDIAHQLMTNIDFSVSSMQESAARFDSLNPKIEDYIIEKESQIIHE